MSMEDYKIVLYRQENGSWVAEIPAIPGCYALMKTREEALAELPNVFSMIEDEYREKGQKLPADTTEIVNAYRYGARISARRSPTRIHTRQTKRKSRQMEPSRRTGYNYSRARRRRNWTSSIQQSSPAIGHYAG